EAVSSKRIKDMIQQMVQNEDVRSPYTDLQIADILQKRSSIKVARRTVAKYREALNILPSNKRKQLF
ncbi:MAG: RNA polymerase sigma-54 factor, partial [Deltaproteobacteria bacterium]